MKTELELELRCVTHKVYMKEELIKDQKKELKQLKNGKFLFLPKYELNVEMNTHFILSCKR